MAGVLLPRQHAHGLAVRAFGVQGDFAQCGGGIKQADRAAFEHLGNNVLGFCRVRGAGHVGDEAAGAGRLNGCVQELTLQGQQLGNIARGLAPTRLGAATQGAQTGAGHIHHHAVEKLAGLNGAGQCGGVLAQSLTNLAAVTGEHRVAVLGQGTHGGFHELGAVRCRLVGDQGCAALNTDSAEQRRLTAGARTQVEPGGVGAVQGCGGKRACHQLGAGILRTDGAFTHRFQACQVAGGVQRRALNQLTVNGALFACLIKATQTGQCHQVHHGGEVVRLKQLLNFGGGATVRHQCLTHGTHNPGGVRGEQSHALGVVLRVLDDEFVPLFRGALRDAAQHRVDEACRARTDLFTCQGHALVQRRVGGNAHVQQLVHAHAQHDQGGGADLLDGAVYAATEDCVVRALVAQRAVGQLGGEACVAVVEAVATNRLGQHEVRVGVGFRYGAQYVEDGCAGGVCGTRACGGCRRGEFAGGHGAAVAFVAALIALGGAAATAFGVVVFGLGAACGAFDAGQAVKAAAGARFGAGVVVPLLRAALGTLVLRALGVL